MSGHSGMGRNKMWHRASKELSHLLRHPHEHPTLAHLVDLATGYMKIQDCVLLLKMERQELLRMIQSSVRHHGHMAQKLLQRGVLRYRTPAVERHALQNASSRKACP